MISDSSTLRRRNKPPSDTEIKRATGPDPVGDYDAFVATLRAHNHKIRVSEKYHDKETNVITSVVEGLDVPIESVELEDGFSLYHDEGRVILEYAPRSIIFGYSDDESDDEDEVVPAKVSGRILLVIWLLATMLTGATLYYHRGDLGYS